MSRDFTFASGAMVGILLGASACDRQAGIRTKCDESPYRNAGSRPMHLRLAAFPSFLHISHARALFDAPTGNRVERRGAKSLPGGYAKARMMPGTADCVSHEKPINKGGTVMRAGGANREHLIAAPDKKHRFTTDVAEKHGPVRNRHNLNSPSEIRPAEFCTFLVHLIDRNIEITLSTCMSECCVAVVIDRLQHQSRLITRVRRAPIALRRDLELTRTVVLRGCDMRAVLLIERATIPNPISPPR